MAAKKLKIGIQGGKGSFNEEACLTYCKNHKITNYEIVYLYTADRVVKALREGKVDRGICAIHNSIGGVVWETLHALPGSRIKILDSFAIVIRHCLLARHGVTPDEITTIMSHPQALAQTEKTRTKKFPGRRFVSGTGILVDQATAAKHLAEGKLPHTTAVIASRTAGELYGLSILASNLQDLKNNLTTFIFLKR